jgi:hypothetical protein
MNLTSPLPHKREYSRNHKFKLSSTLYLSCDSDSWVWREDSLQPINSCLDTGNGELCSWSECIKTVPESPHSQQERNQWLALLSFESYLFKTEWDMMKDSQALLTKLQAIHAVHTELHTPITS